MATKRVSYHVRLDPDVGVAVVEAAKDHTRTVPNLIEAIVLRCLKEQKRKGK